MEKAKKIKDVTIKIYSKSEHISQILCGFLMLKEKGIIKTLTIFECFDDAEKMPHTALVEAYINGKTVAFDMLDGYNFDAEKTQKYIQQVDAYFKRSYLYGKNVSLFGTDNASKIHPLGFNYQVTYNGNPLDNHKTLYTRVKKMAGYKTNDFFTPDKFETRLNYNFDSPKILFSCRLWDFDKRKKPYLNEMAHSINSVRIQTVRALKTAFPNNFCGGVEVSSLAKAQCPDILLPKSFTNRGTYISFMKQCDICVSTTGLYGSTGWKTGEYIAAARAVVCEPLVYQTTGNFCENKNYLKFESAFECVEKVKNLVDNPELVYNMKAENYKYYNRFLRPDMLVWNALRKVNFFV